MTTRIVVYTCLQRVPEPFLPHLYKLTMGNFGYMMESAKLQLHHNRHLPVVICYGDGWPIGWMLFDLFDKGKLHMFVAKAYRRKGIGRRMAEALKRKHPQMRLGVYAKSHAAKVIKGLAKPCAT